MLISIVTINYNNRRGLLHTMQSVVSQTCQDFEYVIVDGASTDGSIQVIEEQAPPNANVLIEKDRGIYDAMNKGIALAKGKYCLFLNSGDRLAHPQVVEQVMPYLQSDKDFYTGIEHIKGQRKSFYVYPEREVTLPYMWWANIRHQATFIRTSLLKARGYSTKYRIVSDWEQNLYELYVHNATYEAMDVLVDEFDFGGVSNKDCNALIQGEKDDAWKQLFGERVFRWLERRNGEIWRTWRKDRLNAFSKNNQLPPSIHEALHTTIHVPARRRNLLLLRAALRLLWSDLRTLL